MLFIDTRKDGLKPEFRRGEPRLRGRSTALERAWVPQAKASILLTWGPFWALRRFSVPMLLRQRNI